MDFKSFDGTRLNVTEMGDGPPLMLLHGLFSSADTNWVRYGTARRLVEAGFRLILPDLRGHGGSEAPLAPEAWPADVLAMDVEALAAHLGLGDDFVLGGYSLGARAVVRVLARGLRPKAAILAGMGLTGIVDGAGRGQWFIRMIEGAGSWERGSGEYVAEAFMKANVRTPAAIVHLLRGQLGTPPGVLAGLDLPVAVLCGADDRDNGSAPELAAALPRADYLEIPGTHMSAVTRPELALSMLDWLRGAPPAPPA
jgi:pimeloyl-ACP methyl ester carboxylesterase